MYALWLSGNDVESNVHTGCNYSQIGPFNKAWVSVSTDGGTTWTSHLAWQGAFDPVTKIGDNADKIFSTITVDTSHQVHVALSTRHNDDPLGFVTQCQVNQGACAENPQATDLYLVTSPDSGQHWTEPFQINKTAGSFFFPWLSAGSAGIVDATYYSSTTLQPNKPSSVWYVGLSQITGAVASYTGGDFASYTSTPVATAEILLDPNPIHGDGTTAGGICTFGIFCSAVPGANRGLADVFEVHVDPAGGANVSWTKDLGGRRIFFACQNSGASAFAGAPDLNGCYGPADLSITKTDSPDPVLLGQALTYHLTVTNNGRNDAFFPFGDFTLLDDRGRVFDSSQTETIIVGGNSTGLLPPSLPTETAIVFTAAADVGDIKHRVMLRDDDACLQSGDLPRRCVSGCRHRRQALVERHSQEHRNGLRGDFRPAAEQQQRDRDDDSDPRG